MDIMLSQIKDRAAFEQAVAAHIEKLKAFAHEKDVPRPVAHPLVDACIKRIVYPKADKRPDDYEAAYTIVDDTPPPPPPLSLVDRKLQLLARLRNAEAKAIDEIIPGMKRRFVILRFQATAVIPEDDRNDEQKAIVADYLNMQEKISAIELKAAEAEAGIDDLTEETIDGWQLPEFG